jgi:prepilin peptidase CpaA
MSPLLESGRLVVASLFTLVLGWAATSDIRTRTIPNRAVLGLVVLFLPWALLNWGVWDAEALLAGLIALTIGVVLYALGVVGAGDAKLFGAVALFSGLGHLLPLGLVTALVGGVIALASLAARPRRALMMVMFRGKGDFGRGIPYGVAIATAGGVVVWAALLGAPLPYCTLTDFCGVGPVLK